VPFRQRVAFRAIETTVTAAHPELTAALDAHSLTLDSVAGEVTELEPFSAMMSKIGAQFERILERLTAEWQAVRSQVPRDLAHNLATWACNPLGAIVRLRLTVLPR
jgi:hypothetical protein